MLAIGRGTMHIQCGETLRAQLFVQHVRIERMMHRVARLRMRQVERQQWRSRQTVTRAAQRDTRIGELPQRVPWILFEEVAHAMPIQSFAPCSSGCCDDALSNVPRASVICIDSSHSSNSGARRRPSTSRTYRASWKDVL